eukprot:GHVU01029490.1.p1 GENE.GHVU01029490.1~~GHVU01029490.1.p1  ORF type:complete len:278 (+),score=47.44 GHVU01029490.1:228-1061(+)
MVLTSKEEEARRKLQEKKKQYFLNLIQLATDYPRVLVVHADHVGSKQLASVRMALRGKAVLVMGKNTKIRTALKQNLTKFPRFATLIELVKMNVGFIFCIEAPDEVVKIIKANRVPARAREGVFAPVDVFVPPGPTSVDPTQTSFFQALSISTKIVKGQIEIQNEVHLLKKGDKVGASEATLLQKLDICPFDYGLEPTMVYDNGSVYEASVLDWSDDIILEKFQQGVKNVAAFGRATGLTNEASAPHTILEAFKNCAAIALATTYSFPQVEALKGAA